MEAYVVCIGTWELDPTRPSSIGGCGNWCLKFTDYRYTVSMSNDGRNVTMNLERMTLTCLSCLPLAKYTEGTQVVTVATWDDEQNGYHFPGHSGDVHHPEYILRSTSQGVFTASDPMSGKEICSHSYEGPDKLRLEGPEFVICMRRVGPRPSPPVMALGTAAVSPTTMKMEEHNASATVPVAAAPVVTAHVVTAPAAKPGYINITVPPGKSGGDILESFVNPKSGMPIMVLIPYDKKEGDVFEQFVG
ncbi:hypothetical protein TrLO_g3037 [Triparma laevis f. longispina]|uniref:Uncharacterized protein n=1 Tax=Triparma laevis f. longispina TaxID=1714387 RepID=A0A9W7E4J2_9STRA|nr:hypothetical protein TrLO_g3037 [Triparma laevis f. longispina]